MTDPFGGVLRITPGGGKNALHTEFDAFIDTYQAAGFKVPADATISMMVQAVGGAFIETEFPDTHYLKASPATQNYFGREVRPALTEQAGAGDVKALRVAQRVGRLIGAAYNHGLLTLGDGSFMIDADRFTSDGVTQPYGIETGYVLDFGMGMVGLFNHVENARDGVYSVLAIQKTRGEQVALQGLARQQAVPAENLQVFADGIKENVDALIQDSGTHLIDMLVASRVHMAGRDLEYGIGQAAMLLRAGGTIIARGPRNYPAGTDYDRLLALVKRNPQLLVTTNKLYSRPNLRQGGFEPNRLIIATTNN